MRVIACSYCGAFFKLDAMPDASPDRHPARPSLPLPVLGAGVKVACPECATIKGMAGQVTKPPHPPKAMRGVAKAVGAGALIFGFGLLTNRLLGALRPSKKA
jgi:hypothetical protein